MKKIIIGLAVLLLSYAIDSLAFLSTGGESSVRVPYYCGRFTFGMTGLGWRSTINDLDFALSDPTDSTSFAPIITNSDFNANHDYNWGLKVDIGYVLPRSGNNANLAYTHWGHREHFNIVGSAFPSTITPFFSLGVLPIAFPASSQTVMTAPVAGLPAFTIPVEIPAFAFSFTPEDIKHIAACSNLQNNTWDLDFGQTVNIGCNFRLHWFGGLRYSWLRHSLEVATDFASSGTVALPTIGTGSHDAIAVSVVPVFDVVATLKDISIQRSRFAGVGPHFGFDGSYYLGRGFGMVGSVATSVLIGEAWSSFSERLELAATASIDVAATTVTSSSVPLPITAISMTPSLEPEPLKGISFRHPDEYRNVPNMDGKLGLEWTHQFCNCANALLAVEAGYRTSYYFKALDRLSGIEAISPEIRTRDVLDISFTGPYICIHVTG
jgi:Legionella pneumophila major outer membrane protein precursor